MFLEFDSICSLSWFDFQVHVFGKGSIVDQRYQRHNSKLQIGAWPSTLEKVLGVSQVRLTVAVD